MKSPTKNAASKSGEATVQLVAGVDARDHFLKATASSLCLLPPGSKVAVSKQKFELVESDFENRVAFVGEKAPHSKVFSGVFQDF